MRIQIDVRWPRFLRERPRWARLTVAGLAAAGVIAVPMALASDIFTDVGDANPFHNDIGAVFRAGITAGKTCVPPGTPPTYCPQEGITREAMAAFVHRGFGRVAGDMFSGGPIPITGAETDVDTLTIQVGGQPGSTQFVKLDGFLTTYIQSATGCPCNTRLRIDQDGEGNISEFVYNTNATPGPSGYDLQGAAVTTAVAVPSGTTQTFRLKAVRFNSATGTVEGFGTLHAATYPFGSTGTNVLGGDTTPSGTGPAAK